MPDKPKKYKASEIKILAQDIPIIGDEIDGGKTSEPTGAVRDPNPVVNLGRDVYDAAKAGVEKIGNAFRPYQTYPITQDPIGRGVEGAGRFGEAMLALGGVASAPFAPLINRIPFLDKVDSGLDKAIESQPLFKGFQAYAEGKHIPEVAETGKEIMKQGMYGAATAGIAKGGTAFKNRGGGVVERNLTKGKKLYNLSNQPTAKELTRPQDLNRMIPYLKESQKASPTQYKYQDMENSVVRQVAQKKYPEIKNKIYNQRDAFIKRNENAPVINFGARVGSAVEEMRNILTENVELLKDKSILDESAKWKNVGQVTLREASTYLRHLNDNLHDFYKRSNEVQAATEGKADPIIAMEKAADKIRDIIADELSDLGENAKHYKKLSEDYGSAARLEASAERNIVKSESPNPPFLSKVGERVNLGGKAGVFARVDPLARYHNQNAYLQKAMNKFAKYGQDVLTPPSTIKTIIGDAGGKFIGIQKFPKSESLVLFDEPSGSTLALKQSEVTPENVKAKIEEYQRKSKK